MFPFVPEKKKELLESANPISQYLQEPAIAEMLRAKANAVKPMARPAPKARVQYVDNGFRTYETQGNEEQPPPAAAQSPDFKFFEAGNSPETPDTSKQSPMPMQPPPDAEKEYLGQLADQAKSVQPNNKSDFLAYMERLKKEADDAYQKQLSGMDAKSAEAKRSDAGNSAFHGVMAGIGQMLNQPGMYQSEVAQAHGTPAQDAQMKLRKEALDYAQKRYDPEKLAAGYLTSQGQDVTSQGQKMSAFQTLANQEGQRTSREQQSLADKARLAATVDNQARERALQWAQLNELKSQNSAKDSLEKLKILQEGEAKRGAVGDKEDQKIEKETEELSKRFQKGVGADTIAEFRKAIEEGKKTGDLPGFGRVVGRFAPSIVSQDGTKLRSAAQDLMDLRLRARSGANAPEPEVEKMKLQYGMFPGATIQETQSGFERLLNDTEQELRQIEGGYSPLARERFRKQGGKLTNDLFSLKDGEKSSQPQAQQAKPTSKHVVTKAQLDSAPPDARMALQGAIDRGDLEVVQ